MSAEERIRAIAELKEALEELRSDEGLATFVEGHGVQSMVFAWRWSDGKRDVDIRLPYARVMESEERQKADDDEIAAAINMALLLLLIDDEAIEGRISVFCDDTGTGYSVWSADGQLEDSGEDWHVLVHRIEALLPADAESTLNIIWP